MAQNTKNIKQLSLEELMDIDVSSVDRVENPLSDIPAAVSVLTAEDIIRSGATTIPELLRYVPGVEVARKDSDHWSISIRGFASQFSKYVLVLIDGRIVYTPLFEGVFWDVQDVPVENIQRIEVIRGPGGTIWGTNAVNGVINIITKNAKLTHGTLVSLYGGNVERADGMIRYGSTIDKTVDYRAFIHAFDRGPEFHPDGLNYDQWRLAHGGVRFDATPNNTDSWMIQGDIYRGSTGEGAAIGSFNPPAQLVLTGNDQVSGGDVLAQWQRKRDDGAEFQVNTYYDSTNRTAPHFEERRSTFDVNFTHKLPTWRRQDFIWGLEGRISPSHFIQTIPTLNFQPAEKTYSEFGAFLQDEIHFHGDKLSLTLGSKFDRNNYTGLEIQPSIRFLAKPNSNQTFWAAVTRAVRTPARTDEDVILTVFAAPGVYGAVVGNPNLQAEQLIAYETGYRSVVTSKLGLDLDFFRNNYSDLVDVGPGSVSAQTSPIPHLLVTLPWVNGMNASTTGFEIAPDVRVLPNWRVRAGYSFVEIHAEDKPNNTDVNALLGLEGSSPKHVFFAQSMVDLPRRFEFDPTLRSASELPNQQVRGYTTADVRVSWRATEQVQLSVVGQNLLQPHHAEFGRDLPPIVGIRRAAYVSLRWQP